MSLGFSWETILASSADVKSQSNFYSGTLRNDDKDFMVKVERIHTPHTPRFYSRMTYICYIALLC